MITIDENAEIIPGNIIYNPTENVKYKVTDLGYYVDLKTPFVYLKPLPPFGTSTSEFRISIGSMIALGFVLEGETSQPQRHSLL